MTTAVPCSQKRGQLVAQGLSAAGGHDREDVLFVQDGADDGLLVRPEGFETEDRAEGMTNRHVARLCGSIHDLPFRIFIFKRAV